MSYTVQKPVGCGFYLRYPDGFKRTDVDPPASGWFKSQVDAETEMVRLAELTNDAFFVMSVVSKCVPWHHDNYKQDATP